MIQDVTRRWESRGPHTMVLALSGSALGVLARVTDDGGETERWSFAQGGVSVITPERAAEIVRRESDFGQEVFQGQVMSSAEARPDSALRAEQLLDLGDTPHEIRYREGDFIVQIRQMPGIDSYNRFSVMLEIAVSDSDGYYMVHREETRHWGHWPRALRYLMGLADDHIRAHVGEGDLDNLDYTCG